MHTQEFYNPLVIGVNSVGIITGASIGGFLAVTSGTITITRTDSVVVVAALPVTAGNYTKLPFHISTNGGICTTAGGASGVLAVG